jgi:hypothetical protein
MKSRIPLLICLGGVLVAIFGIVLQQKAGEFEWEGSSAGYQGKLHERRARADLVIKTGGGMFGVGLLWGASLFLLKLRHPDPPLHSTPR